MRYLWSILAIPWIGLATICADEDLIKKLQEKVERLEQIVEQQQKTIESLHPPTQKQKKDPALHEEVEEIIASEETENSPLFSLQSALDIEFSVTFSAIAAGTSGVKNRVNDEGDRIDGTFTLDFAFAASPIPQGNFFLLLEVGSGLDTGLDAKIETFSGFVDESGEDFQVQISEAWYEHLFFGELLRVRIGQLDFAAEFDTNEVANDGTSQFFSSALVNNPAVAFPDFTIGAFFILTPREFIDIKLGVADADGDYDQILDEIFAIAEIDFHWDWNYGELWCGNYRVYAWLNDDDDIVDIEDGERKTGYGFGTSIDQMLFGIATVFARYGYQRETVFAFDHAVSLGIAISGQLWQRDDDTLALAWSHILPGETFRDANAGVNFSNETLLEFYYRFGYSEYLAFSLFAQALRHPLADDDNGTILVVGTRGTIAF